jgi:hypothetical protein
MVRKVSAAIIVSLGVALVPIANQAFAGSARALLPVAAWGTYGGLSVGPYGGLNIGPYSSPFCRIVRRCKSLHLHLRYPLGLGTPVSAYCQPSRAATRTGCARAELRPTARDGSWSDGKDQTITMVRC